jgi:hypothetical protein
MLRQPLGFILPWARPAPILDYVATAKSGCRPMCSRFTQGTPIPRQPWYSRRADERSMQLTFNRNEDIRSETVKQHSPCAFLTR